MSKQIVLYFGSFNPPHIGHTALASFILENNPIDELWFVVSPQNPLKEKSALISARTRLEMTRLAVSNHPHIRVSDIEFYLPQPNYTIFTLTVLSEKFPDYHFGILMGADNLVHFHKWKNYKAILENHHIWCYPRPGYEIPDDFASHPSVSIIDAPQFDLSSSMIRKMIKENKDIRFFVRENVFAMIDCEGLYR